MSHSSKNIITDNKKAYFDYEVIDTYEAGIVLYGEEVKSVRSGNITLKGSYALIQKTQVTAVGIHIGEYKNGERIIASKRERTLLLRKDQILKLSQKVKETGATLIPLQVYTSGNLIKVSLGLARGKKHWQKKETLKARDLDRELSKKFRP